MIGVLVLLAATLLVFSSCTDTDTETVTETVTETTTETTTETVTETTTETVTETTTETVTEVYYMCPDGETKVKDIEMCDEYFEPIGTGYDKGTCYQDGDDGTNLEGTGADDCIDGEGGNDAIKGMGGNDTLKGGPGNDHLYGGADNDTLIGGPGNNYLDGGEGKDTADYENVKRVVANLAESTARVQHGDLGTEDPLTGTSSSGIGEDTLMKIENVKGSNSVGDTTYGGDTITGNGMDNLLIGLDGADKLDGGGGADTIIPNRQTAPALNASTFNDATDVAEGETRHMDGIDTINGGEGDDTVSYEGEADTFFTDTGGSATGVGARSLTINLSGQVTLAANSNPDYIPAILNATNDNYDTTDMIVVDNIGTKDVPKWQSTIENITGGSGDDILTGDTRANVLTGGAGGDTLRGELATATTGGDDTLNGGAGVDALYGGPGNDTLNGGLGNDTTLEGGAGDDTLDGGGGNDTLTGNDGDDTYIITKNDVDTIFEFVVGDMIHLKGFTSKDRTENNLAIDTDPDPDQLQLVDKDNSSVTTPVANITTGANLIRLTQDVKFID